MHTRVEPKGTLLDPDRYDDVVADVTAFLRERMDAAIARGVAPEQILLDPGPDFAKTPAQTVARPARDRAAARARAAAPAGRLHKDFVGAITGRGPRERLAGTLAAVGAWRRRRGGACCASTTSPRRPTSCACARCCAARSSSRPAEGLTPDRYPA